ncbi:hypothetical protein BDZ91DRAFT_797129 [Kalaharituber pfeilii]|nr:hypothetical protein BDZ91DRAFT_797129 [Kalaharituber pfeilii]
MELSWEGSSITREEAIWRRRALKAKEPQRGWKASVTTIRDWEITTPPKGPKGRARANKKAMPRVAKKGGESAPQHNTAPPQSGEKAVTAVTPVQQTPQQQNDKKEDSATNPQTGPKTKESAPPPDASKLGGNQQKTENNKPPLAKRIWQARVFGGKEIFFFFHVTPHAAFRHGRAWKEIDEDPAARSLTEHKMMRDRINKNLGSEAPYKVRFTALDPNFPKERILLMEDTSHKTGPRKMAPLEKAQMEGHQQLAVDQDYRMVVLVTLTLTRRSHYKESGKT